MACVLHEAIYTQLSDSNGLDMAEKDVLSQEEIDALLESVDEVAEDEGAGEQAEPTTTAAEGQAAETSVSPLGTEATSIADEIKTINFTGQERIVKGQMPVLDKIYDRAARLFSSEIYHITGRDFQIKQDPLAMMKSRDFMGALPNPSFIGIYKIKPLRGKGIIIFDSTFVYDIVDYYFGGSSQFFAQKDKSDFTASELKVMEVVSKKLTNNLITAWEPIMSIDVTKISVETNPQLVNITEPHEMLVVARFCLDFGKETGTFHFVFPYSMMEPIKQQLELGASRPDEEIDPNWIKSLKEELMDVELTVTAAMTETISSLGKVMAWQVGDFVPLEMSEIVCLDIEGNPSFTASLGTLNDARALKIIKKISY